MQQHTNEELSNLLVESLISRDEKLLQKVLNQEDESIIKEILIRLPVNYVRKLAIELGNLLSTDISIKVLKWIQHLLASKYSVISTMSDGRSILMPLVSILDDRSSPQYYNKLLALKGKITLLQQLKESRRLEMTENVVRVAPDEGKVTQMVVDSDTDTEDELEEAEEEQISDVEDEMISDDGVQSDDEEGDNNEEEFYDGQEDLQDHDDDDE